MHDTTIGCPECGSTNLASIEQLRAYAPTRITLTPSGALHATWGQAPSEVQWDQSLTTGWTCRACDTVWATLDQLAHTTTPARYRHAA